jgi:hypothetical protein
MRTALAAVTLTNKLAIALVATGTILKVLWDWGNEQLVAHRRWRKQHEQQDTTDTS